MSGPWRPLDPAAPLAGVRVVDFGQYIAGPLVALLLADQGADVVRVEPPGGPRWGGAANATLLRGRRTITLDLKKESDRTRAHKLLVTADVAIENFRPGVAERLGVGAGWCGAHAPRLIYCSLPGFGADDPRASMPGWEGVVMAAAGAYSFEMMGALAGVGDGGEAAEFSALPLASVFAATEGALAIVAALVARDRDGSGQRVEVPLHDALFEASGVRAMSIERGGLALTDFGNGFYRCRDGRFVTFVAMWFRHLEWFVRAAGCTAWIDDGLVDYERLWNDPAAVDELRTRLVGLFATRDSFEWEALARAHGCSLAVLRSTEEWLAEPHAVESRTLVDVDDPWLGSVRVPGRAIEVDRYAPKLSGRDPADAADVLAAIDASELSIAAPPGAGRPNAVSAEPDHPARPALAGVRVLDLSRVVAAPTAAKLLAQYGADVIKIDTDPAVGRASFKEPALHEHLNRGKQTMILDVKAEAGREALRAFIARADVVIHNFTPGATSRLGIEESDIRAANPSIVYSYLNAFGTDGPWAEHRGYAELANLTTGITERSRGDQEFESGRSPLIDNPRWFFTDYAAGVLGAFATVVALYARGRDGRGRRAVTSLVRAASLEQLPYLVGGARDAAAEPRGLARGWSDAQRLYESRDGHVFFGATASQLARLQSELGDVTRAFASMTTQAAAEAAARVGAAAHRVEDLRTLMQPGGVADRRGLRVDDRTETTGAIVMPGPVARLSRTPMHPGALPGPFGSDEAAIRARWG